MMNEMGSEGGAGDDAVVCTIDREGTKKWQNALGRLHRSGDAPAVVKSDGTQEWWWNGRRHRDGDAPAIVWADGSQYWYKEDELHRDGDAPACIVNSIWGQYKCWYLNGKRHRAWDLPATVWPISLMWWVHGVHQSAEDCARNRRWSPLRAAFFASAAAAASKQAHFI